MITNEKFKTMNFATHGFIEPIYDNASYRLPSNHKLNAYPCSELRSLISNVIHNVSKTTKTSIEELITLNCNISYSTYSNICRGRIESHLVHLSQKYVLV